MHLGRETAAVLCALALALPALAQEQHTGSRTINTTPQARTNQMQRLVDADRLDGLHIYGLNGNDLGEVERLLINPNSGRIELVVMSHGGFLELGEQRTAVPWQAFSVVDKGLMLSITEEQLTNAPRFNDRETASLEPGYASRVYAYWGYDYDPATFTQGVGLAQDRRGATGQMGATPKSGESWVGTIDRQGQNYVLRTGDGAYQISSEAGDLSGYLGRQVNVTGTLAGNTLHPSAITPAANPLGGSATKP